MQEYWIVVAAAAGVLGGMLTGRLFSREGEKARELIRARQELGRLQERLLECGAEAARYKTAWEEAVGRREEQEARHRENLETLEDRFRTLSGEIYSETTRSFLTLAREELQRKNEDADRLMSRREEAIGDMVAPLHEHLEKVNARIGQMERERIDAFGAVSARMTDMLKAQGDLRTETANLVKALRLPQVRGRWGEVQLKRVVELAGMTSHVDFYEQESLEGAQGRQRPDMVIRLPGDKVIVVDAKTPLMAYLSAVEAADERTAALHLREHAAQVKTQITKLAQKSYWAGFEDTPEFVVLFLPGEPFFSAALEQDPGLIEYGAARGVLLATPTTLIALLKSAALGWQQDKLTRDAREISRMGRELYDRIRVLAGHFGELKSGLSRSVAAYNRMAGSFESRVLVSARKFGEYGLSGGQEISEAGQLEVNCREAPEENSGV